MINVKNKKVKYLGFLLVGFILLSAGCDRMFRERQVDKKELLGYDYRLFQGTNAWEIAKAVWDNDCTEIKLLVNQNKNLLNSTDSMMGHTLLMFTIWHQQYNTFKCLLELGADVNIHDRYAGTSAIIEACKMEKDNISYVSLLLQYGANINDVEVGQRPDGNSIRDSPLLAACRKGKTELVKLLVQSGADLNYKNEYNHSALNQATIQDHYDIVLYLLKQNIDYNLPIFYRENEKKTFYLIDVLREKMFRLNSSEHKLKMEIVSLLRNKGIEYKDVPIPDYITQKAKEEYPNTWQEYLKNY